MLADMVRLHLGIMFVFMWAAFTIRMFIHANDPTKNGDFISELVSAFTFGKQDAEQFSTFRKKNAVGIFLSILIIIIYIYLFSISDELWLKLQNEIEWNYHTKFSSWQSVIQLAAALMAASIFYNQDTRGKFDEKVKSMHGRLKEIKDEIYKREELNTIKLGFASPTGEEETAPHDPFYEERLKQYGKLVTVEVEKIRGYVRREKHLDDMDSMMFFNLTTCLLFVSSLIHSTLDPDKCLNFLNIGFIIFAPAFGMSPTVQAMYFRGVFNIEHRKIMNDLDTLQDKMP